MYMMFIEGELKPGKKDEFVKAWNNQIMPLLKKQDGFDFYALLCLCQGRLEAFSDGVFAILITICFSMFIFRQVGNPKVRGSSCWRVGNTPRQEAQPDTSMRVFRHRHVGMLGACNNFLANETGRYDQAVRDDFVDE